MLINVRGKRLRASLASLAAVSSAMVGLALLARGSSGPVTVGPGETYRHGPFLLVPEGSAARSDAVKPIANPAPPAPSASGIEETSRSDLWREPRFIPDEYELFHANSPRLNTQIELLYRNASGGDFVVYILRWQIDPIVVPTWDDGVHVYEAFSLDDMPAVLQYALEVGLDLWAYDESSGEGYVVQGGPDLSLENAIEIVKGLRQ